MSTLLWGRVSLGFKGVLESKIVADGVTIRIIQKISEIERESWDRLLGGGSPFLKWDWLDALEATGCVRRETGWLPHHLIVESGKEVIGACPTYLKLHSMGEFVFDFEWAEFAHRIGVNYYPKMLVGVPFTPVTGPRFLTHGGEGREELIELMGRALAQIAREHRLSSIHVNFCLEEEAGVLKRIGFIPRGGLQFHWHNRGYGSFEDYLNDFRSDRRNKIKRERRELLAQGIDIRAVEGEELSPKDLETMFRLYKRHIGRLYYGRQYLNREFFREVLRRLAPHLCMIFAKRGSETIAGTFNLQDRTALYGRYWGCFTEERYLHFNVCYYSAIEHCIRKGLRRFEAGAGGGFKQFRGFEPEPTTSAHFIVEEKFRRAIERHLRQERAAVAEKREALLERSQLKNSTG